MIFHRRFFKRLKLLWGEVELHFKSASISTDNGRTSTLSSFYCISNQKNFILKYLDNVLTNFAQTSLLSRRLLNEKALVNDFGRRAPRTGKYDCQ